MADNPSRLVREHPELFHYTTLEGLRGILESQTLWATHYRFLNDSTEIEHLRAKLKEQLFPIMLDVAKRLHKQDFKTRRKMKNYGGVFAVAKKETDALINTCYGITFEGEGKSDEPFASPYITSFCSHQADTPYERENGLLSQWRAYGGKGGIAIVFDTSRLLDLFRKEAEINTYSAWVFGGVVYEGDQERFRREFQPVVEHFVQLHSDVMHRSFTTDVGQLYYEFVKAASRFKHRAFEEEREIRMVLCPMSAEMVEQSRREDTDGVLIGRQVKQVKFRRSKSKRIPYIEAFAFKGKRRLPIKRIIVGPHSDQRMLECRVKDIVGRRRIKVQCSKTPYREQG